MDNLIDNLLFDILNEYDYFIKNFNKSMLIKLSNEIYCCKNNIFITGVGKSETIALHLTNLLKSVGIKVFNLNVMNSLHGDIGSICSEDLVLMFSKSGNTEELLELSKYIKKKNTKIWGICCSKISKFDNCCDEIIALPHIKELETGTIKTLPTNSCLIQLIFCNLLTVMVTNKININLDEYRSNHPAGNIGSKLKKIKDEIIYKFPKVVLNKKILLQDVLLEMTEHCIGCCFFTNKYGTLLGLLTDGDIRRILVNNIDKKYIFESEINKDFYFETDIEKLISNIEVIKKKKFIPILTEERKIFGIIKN